MSNREFNTHVRGVDIYTQRDVEMAECEIGRYCDPETLAPKLVVAASDLVRRVHIDRQARGTMLHDEQALDIVGQGFMSYRKSGDYRIGDVSLDISPDVDGRPQLWGHVSAPQVVFTWLRPGSYLTQNGKFTAGAFWFQPDPAVTSFWKGREQASPWVANGYLGWVDFFTSKSDAKLALDELIGAVRVLATPLPDEDEPEYMADIVREEEIEEDRRETALRRAQNHDF